MRKKKKVTQVLLSVMMKIVKHIILKDLCLLKYLTLSQQSVPQSLICNEIVDPINMLSNLMAAFTLHPFPRYSNG